MVPIPIYTGSPSVGCTHHVPHTAHGLDDHYPLKAMQGSLIPAGVNYGFTNDTDADVTFLSMRTESSGGRRKALQKPNLRQWSRSW